MKWADIKKKIEGGYNKIKAAFEGLADGAEATVSKADLDGLQASIDEAIKAGDENERLSAELETASTSLADVKGKLDAAVASASSIEETVKKALTDNNIALGADFKTNLSTLVSTLGEWGKAGPKPIGGKKNTADKPEADAERPLTSIELEAKRRWAQRNKK